MRPRSVFPAVHVLAALALFGVVVTAAPTATTAQPQIEPGVQVGVTSTTHGGNPASPIRGTATKADGRDFRDCGRCGSLRPPPRAEFHPEGHALPGRGRRAGTGAGLRSYVELPVLASVRLSRWGRVTPVVFGGPALGLRVGTGEHRHDLDRRTAVSVVVGSGVDVRVGGERIGALSLDARYQMGVREVSYRRSAGPTDP